MNKAIDQLIDNALHSDERLAAALKHRAGEAPPVKSLGSAFAYRNLQGNVADLAAAMQREQARLATVIDEKKFNERRRSIQRELTALREMEAFVEAAPHLSKHEGSFFHKAIEAGVAGRVMGVEEELNGPRHVTADEWRLMKEQAQVFIIDHDWAAVFKRADIEGEVRAPYDVTCFEMTVNGRRCCYVQSTPTLSDSDGIVFVETSAGWFFLGRAEQDEKSPIARFLIDQVRAVCISLDAEVATTEIIRAPYRLNAARAERGKLPMFDYRVVSLAKRSRAEPLRSPTEPGHHKRLHWRRGHWRHYASHKTWVKWMLVGDPDLGFIDKHYRV